MAPDVNSLPSSPRQEQPPTTTSPSASTTASRRASHAMPPPPAHPASSSTVAQTHSHHHHHVHRAPISPVMSNEGPGMPLRHPRPLTAAELYLECEKEQEAVVNRLTRELTALRAQSASVASNASLSSSSTSASLLPVDISDPNPTHQLTGATHPTPSRRHRSSSSLSNRSIPTPSTALSNSVSSLAHGPASVPIGGVSQASADRAAAATGGNALSRQGSISASGTSTPARQSLDTTRHGTSYTLPHRPSLSRDPSYASTMNTSSTAAHAGTPAPPSATSPTQQSPSASVHAAMQHYADTAAYRTEMEIVKAENEALRQRVRALERALRSRRRDSSQSDAARPDLRRTPSAGPREAVSTLASPTASTTGAGVAAWAATDGGVGGVAPPRERSESQSTTASSRRGPSNVNEDDVRVGESAQSAGYQRGL